MPGDDAIPVPPPPAVIDRDQWWRLAVTQQAPAHVWHLGKGVQDAFDGFTVQTDEHVWLEAKEGGARSPDGGGTLTAQAEGRVWLQADRGPLSFVADDKAIFGTKKSGLTIAGKTGVTLLADSRIKGSTVDPNDPKGGSTIEAEDDAADVSSGWSTWWTTLDTATALGLNLMDIGMAAATTGLPMPTSPSGWIGTIIGAGANLAGAGANFAGLAGSGAAGMSLLAEGGMLIGSPIAVNIWGAPGAVLGGAFTTVFGGVSTGVLAGLDASLSAIGPVDLSAVALASVASLSKRISPGVEIASRAGPTLIQGVLGYTLQGGGVKGRAAANIHIDVAGWMDMYAPKGQVAFKSNVATVVAAGTALAFGMTPPVTPMSLVPEAYRDDVAALSPIQVPFVPLPPVLYPNVVIALPTGVKMCAGIPTVDPIIEITADKIEIRHTDLAKVTFDATGAQLQVSGRGVTTKSLVSFEADSDEVVFEELG